MTGMVDEPPPDEAAQLAAVIVVEHRDRACESCRQWGCPELAAARQVVAAWESRWMRAAVEAGQ